MTKDFPTLLVGSATSGVVLGKGLSASNIQELAEWALGHPVWTHELADRKVWQRLSDRLVKQFPQLPVRGDDAVEDWKALGAKLVREMGETLAIRKGSDERTEDPISSLQRLAPDKPIVVIYTTQTGEK
jgi:hypothetical protein